MLQGGFGKTQGGRSVKSLARCLALVLRLEARQLLPFLLLVFEDSDAEIRVFENQYIYKEVEVTCFYGYHVSD